MATKLGMVNAALSLLGESSIQEFTGDKGEAIDSIYKLVRDQLLSSNRWRFAVKKAAITVDSTAPLNEFKYRHAVPSDLLLLIRVYGVSHYEVYEQWIYTDVSGIEVDYLYASLEKNYPKYFEWAFVTELAYQLSIAITNNMGVTDRMEGRARDAYLKAQHDDAQGRPSTAIRHRPFLDVRR